MRIVVWQGIIEMMWRTVIIKQKTGMCFHNADGAGCWHLLLCRSWGSWWTTTIMATYFRSSPSQFRIGPLSSWKSFKDTTIRLEGDADVVYGITLGVSIPAFGSKTLTSIHDSSTGLWRRKLQISLWSHWSRPACQRQPDRPDTKWHFEEHLMLSFANVTPKLQLKSI